MADSSSEEEETGHLDITQKTPAVLLLKREYVGNTRDFFDPKEVRLIDTKHFASTEQIRYLNDKTISMGIRVKLSSLRRIEWHEIVKSDFFTYDVQLFELIYVYLSVIGRIDVMIYNTKMNEDGEPYDAYIFRKDLKDFCEKGNLPCPRIYFGGSTEKTRVLEMQYIKVEITTPDKGFGVEQYAHTNILQSGRFILMGTLYV